MLVFSLLIDSQIQHCFFGLDCKETFAYGKYSLIHFCLQKYVFFLIMTKKKRNLLCFYKKIRFSKKKIVILPQYNIYRRMTKRVLIIGNHPLIADLKRQYGQRGDEVMLMDGCKSLAENDLSTCKEVVILADFSQTPMDADNAAMSKLRQLATNYKTENNDGKRLLCHLLLRSQSLLHMIRLEGLHNEIELKLEVNPFTLEDEWCRTIALGLDREPITIQSEKIVHLVIFGLSSVAEQVAINAAHVCHFPNYTKKEHTLRTRITLIDEHAFEKAQEWIQRYKHLFDNSYYRFVDTKKRPVVTDTLKPIYINREDFVDVEWEFVQAPSYDNLVRIKISQWAKSNNQQLTLVFASIDTEQALSDAQHLPDEVSRLKFPVYVYMQRDDAYQQIRHSNETSHLIPFGMVDYGYDINIPFVKMAKIVNYVYDRCYNENIEQWDGHMKFSIEINNEKKEQLWAKRFGVKRMSNIYNAMTIGVKMRSMGFEECDWEKFYDLSQEDIELLAEVEHNRWSVEELILGFRPCNDSELKEIASSIDTHNKKRLEKGEDAVKGEKTLKDTYKEKKKIHYDLRAYSELCPDGTGKPVQVYDRCLSACIPLIAKESKRGSL